MKKFFKTMFFITLALILIYAVCVVSSFALAEKDHSESVGIIGGADGPTAILITRTLVFGSSLFNIFCLLMVLFVVSAIGFVITRKK
jgi:succinate-acetate transporter protein